MKVLAFVLTAFAAMLWTIWHDARSRFHCVHCGDSFKTESNRNIHETYCPHNSHKKGANP